MFTKGVAKLGGRQKGTPNKLTSTFREAVLLTYDGIGGHSAFMQWARENPTEFYRIAARLIPAEMGRSEDDRVIVIVNRDGRPPAQPSALENHSNGWEGA